MSGKRERAKEAPDLRECIFLSCQNLISIGKSLNQRVVAGGVESRSPNPQKSGCGWITRYL